jgi:predicted nucleic acid binding AN1-type Zn finger protein
MPTSEIRKDAREGKGSVKSLEKKWDKAKDASKKSTGKDDDWALTNYIYKKERDACVGSTELNAASRLLGSCPVCAVVEGCDHTVPERERASK